MITCHAHTSGVAMSAATERGYESLPHPFYLIDLAPSEALTSICDFIVSTEDFLRGRVKVARLAYRNYRNSGINALKLAEIT